MHHAIMSAENDEVDDVTVDLKISCPSVIQCR